MSDIPGSVSDKIDAAVREAVACGVEPRAFVVEAASAWSDALNDGQRATTKAFTEMLTRTLR